MRPAVTTLMDLIGAGAIIVGLALLVGIPVALIAGGAMTLLASWRQSR